MDRAARLARHSVQDSTNAGAARPGFPRRAVELIGVLVAVIGITVTARHALGAERRVVVLMPRYLPAGTWPEGTQAVIAELAASSYQVIVESSQARELDALLSELRARATDEQNAGAVSVVKSRGSGVAYVWTRRDESVARVQSDTTEGAVSEGSFALRVLELIRARGLRLPEEPPAPEAAPLPAAPAPRTQPAPAAGIQESARERRARVWLGMGTTLAQGLPRPLVDAALGARLALMRPLALEASAALSVAPVTLDTSAGGVDLSTRRLTLHLMGDVWRAPRLRVAIGAGGGTIWLAESARGRGGYRGLSDQTFIGLASLRAAATFESGALALGVAVEPGVALQRASIRSNGEELLHLGTTWASVTASIGWSL